MYNISQNSETCGYCLLGTPQFQGLHKCISCRTKGDAVGDIVLGFIKKAAQNTRGEGRNIFMLTGLSSVYLEGIARKIPPQIEKKKILLKINPEVTNNLEVEERFLSRQPATHWRHSDSADIIVFAPPDSEINSIGGSLGSIPIIDENRIVDEIDGWVQLLDPSELQSNYLKAALVGLGKSKVYIDLDRWVNFILSIKRQGYKDPVDKRLNQAAPALHIPIFGITELPQFNLDKTPHQDQFRKAFKEARDQVGVFAELFTPKNERVVIEKIQDAIDNFDTGNDKNLISSIKFVQGMLNDANSIRPGTWLQSQQDFCENVNWGEVGSKIFTGDRRTKSSNIGEETLKYLEGNFEEDITVEEKNYLKSISEKKLPANSEFEARFFERWKERFYNAPNVRLFRSWQGRVFRKEVAGQELLILLLDGFEALFKTGYEKLEDLQDPRILIRTTHPNKANLWESKDREILKLFQFELGSIIGKLKGVVFDLEECFEYRSKRLLFTKDARTVELELYLIDKSDLSSLGPDKRTLSNSPRIKATWQPGSEVKLEPITLALVDDLVELNRAREHNLGYFLNKKFTPTEGSVQTISLQNRNTFNDVTIQRDGRTFEISSQGDTEDLILAILKELKTYQDNRLIEDSVAETINSSIKNFLKYYSQAIEAISMDSLASEGFGSPSILEQARAYGELCKACRSKDLDSNLKRTLQSNIARIGIVFSEDNSAIIPPWHPFRLAEIHTKINALSEFIEGVLTSGNQSDISMEFGDLRKKILIWYFPEIAYYNEKAFVTVESLGGYSLLSPADYAASSREVLENSSVDASKHFAKAVDRYLKIHPHEAANLSVSIFNSESESLPRKFSDLLANRFHKDKDLRCDLIISHSNQERLRTIFRTQNSILSTGEIGDNVKAILSRLRVDVRSHSNNSDSEVPELDLIFLHANISKLAKNSWIIEPDTPNNIKNSFNISDRGLPRRQITDSEIKNSEIYLTCPQPPQAIADYHALLYELANGVSIPEEKRVSFISKVNGDSKEVKQLVEEAHSLADWVVCFDKSINRKILEQCNVNIIQDITTPELDGRVTISSSKIENVLTEKLSQVITNTCQISSDESNHTAISVMKDITTIAGQKLLSSIRNDKIIKEILGLSLLKSRLHSSLPENTNPVWISLDDYRSWITSGKGKNADLMGISVSEDESGFHVYLQIGEAKFISKYSQTTEVKDAQNQVELTLEHIKRSFIDNDNPINLKSWCALLEKLIMSQDFQISKLGDYPFRSRFFEALRNSEIKFHISGDSLICLHDDGMANSVEYDDTKEYLRTQRISRYTIKSLLQTIVKEEIPYDKDLQNVKWYARPEPEPPVLPPPPVDIKEILCKKITKTYQITSEESYQIANCVLEDVRSIAGNNLKSEIRHDNKISEILGHSLLKSRLLASLPKEFNPIWFSLKYFQKWIATENENNADLMGLSVCRKDDCFHVYLQVGTTKHISSEDPSNEIRVAELQSELTVEHIKKNFIDNKNPTNFKSWCNRLENLILSQDIPLKKIGEREFRSQFFESLRNGNIKFHICGDTVICFHDGRTEDLLKHDTSKNYLRTQRISKNTIKSLLQMNALGNIPFNPELQDVKWYSKEDDEVPCPRPPRPQPDEQFLPEPILKVWQTNATNNPEFTIDENSIKWAEEECNRTQKALSDFNIVAKFEEEENRYKLTPNGVLISFQGNRTLTVKSIESKKSELLTTYGLDVSDIRPGKGKVSLYIKREKRAHLPLASSLLRFLPESRQGSFFNFLIGILEDDDRFIPLNLYREYKGFEEHAPHTLIAGETGSGKGVLIQNLILQMITFNNPNNLELYLIDPKMGVDFHWVKDSPHIKDQIISDPQEATQLLGTLVAEMDRRYRKFVEMKVNDLETYNSKVDPKMKLPRIILVHDEMGSWMADNDDYKKVVLSTASNLGMKARAAGIHLILITQRADKDAIPPKLRDNLGNRLCLKVNSKGGSEIVLQCLGAEKLLGKGHIACNLGNQTLPPGQEYFVAQVPFAEQNQIEILAKAAIDYWKDRAPIIVPTDEPPIISSPSESVYSEN